MTVLGLAGGSPRPRAATVKTGFSFTFFAPAKPNIATDWWSNTVDDRSVTALGASKQWRLSRRCRRIYGAKSRTTSLLPEQAVADGEDDQASGGDDANGN